MKKPFVIGIAGGTGSGKTTLAISLYKKNPVERALLHLDDYFKKAPEVPILHGFTNWEDPTSIKFDDLYQDINSLLHWQTITVNTKSELFNPNYHHKNLNKIPYVVVPKPMIIVEGFLILYEPKVRELLNIKIFLEAKLIESSQRRSANKDVVTEQYLHHVLEPMYKQTVEPTKQYADLIIDTTRYGTEDVLNLTETYIEKYTRLV